MKQCSRCKRILPVLEFSKDRRTKDGLQSQCKRCKVESKREWRYKNPEKRMEILRRWKDKNPDKVKEQRKRYNQRYPKKIKAYQFISNNKLELAKECELCGNTENLEHHHPDYDYPEIYVTVCKECHTWIHQPIRIESRSSPTYSET